MKTAIFIYALAMTIANLSISFFGPWVSPINAFLFIGLDLALRDFLHEKINKRQMFMLISASGLITYFLNPSAGIIAIASSASFIISAFVDWAVFYKAKGSWIKRSNVSNVAGSAVDSVVFPTMAFGVLMPEIVVLQFVAKVAGGAFWAHIINKFK